MIRNRTDYMRISELLFCSFESMVEFIIYNTVRINWLHGCVKMIASDDFTGQ